MKRIQLTVSDACYEKIEHYCQTFGVPKSSLCAVLIGQGLLGFDNAQKMMQAVSEQISNDLKGELDIDI